MKDNAPVPTKPTRSAKPAPRASTGYLSAIAVVLLATTIGWLASYGWHIPTVATGSRLANSNVLMLYLLGVLWVATRFSRGAAICASLLGVAAFDFCFVPPYLTFTVADEQYLVTFAVMLVTALTISTLTHRVRLQSEVARQAWERVEVEFLRNTLLSGVSHELRTPLSAITGAASTLIEASDHLSAESRVELLDTIYAEAERMERLISNLLEMSRLESGELAPKTDWVPIAELIGSALARLDRWLTGRDVKIDSVQGLPLVLVDAVGIEQVIVNLLDNALQHTPAGSPIEIGLRSEQGVVTVSITDHGPGLPAGAESRVFDKFFRSHETQNASPRGRGIGLGLAICRAIVEAHNGTINATNRRDTHGNITGAVFTFTLPQTQSPPVVDATG